jgi:hypothetical protein
MEVRKRIGDPATIFTPCNERKAGNRCCTHSIDELQWVSRKESCLIYAAQAEHYLTEVNRFINNNIDLTRTS